MNRRCKNPAKVLKVIVRQNQKEQGLNIVQAKHRQISPKPDSSVTFGWSIPFYETKRPWKFAWQFPPFSLDIFLRAQRIMAFITHKSTRSENPTCKDEMAPSRKKLINSNIAGKVLFTMNKIQMLPMIIFSKDLIMSSVLMILGVYDVSFDRSFP